MIFCVETVMQKFIMKCGVSITGYVMRCQRIVVGSSPTLRANNNMTYDLNNYILENGDPDGICLDIGCNTGMYLDAMSKRFKKVYAFEPHPGYAERCRFLVKNYGLHNVEIFELALHNSYGMMKLYLNDPGSHTLRVFEKDYGHKLDNFVNVPVCRLDDLHIKDTITACKIDVEANEGYLLEGAVYTFTKNPVKISLETHSEVNVGSIWHWFHDKQFAIWDRELNEVVAPNDMKCDWGYLAYR